MSKKLTTKDFIPRAITMHGSRYDYSKVSYVDAKTKVCIICPIHGEFFQNPDKHLHSLGCPLCGIKKRAESKTLTQKEFIERANTVHGHGKYDYSRVVYKKLFEKICIICPTHGEFLQTPANHLNHNNGCPICGNREFKNLTTSVFVNKAVSVHGNKYDYSKVTYISTGKKICIVCPTHGEFYQTPLTHIRGNGCKKCGFIISASKSMSTTEGFIKKAISIHGENFDYSKVNYTGAKKKICIICPIHGEFFQSPTKHLSGHKCPHCKCSKGEKAILSWFTKNNIEYEYQWVCSDLRGYSRKSLIFDFQTKNIKFCIEYDGEQHFKAVRFNGISEKQAIENLKKSQYYDLLKNQYCLKNNIPLLRIGYKEFNDIPEILNEKILGIGDYFQKYSSPKYFVNELDDKEKTGKIACL